MLNILVVDDENIVIDSIKYIVEKNFDDVFIVGTAISGREAIEKAELVKPDLIFMDIKMPGINGIDAIKEIKSGNSNPLFVIISASEQFEFAKEAVNLQVFEFLQKPVNQMKIIQIIKKASISISEAREKLRKELEMMEKIESVLPILEHGFIFSILINQDFTSELQRYRKIFNLNEQSGYIMTIDFSEEQSPGILGNVIGSSVMTHSFYPVFRDILKEKCKCIIGPVMVNRIVVYVPTDKQTEEYSERLEALDIAEYILEKLSEKINSDFYIGIGSKINGDENILKSYEESLKSIKSLNHKGIAHIKDISEECEFMSDYPILKEKYILQKAESGETIECLQAFNYIFEWLSKEYNESVKEIKGRLTELIVMLHRLALEYEIKENDNLKREDYLSEFLAIDEISTLKVWCKNRIDNIINKIRYIRAKRLSNIVSIAKAYIDNNFEKEILLEDVSKEVKLSPHYFSKFFKEETGENFIDYLTSVRINNAKKLLESGMLSIKEICFKVGYNDPNYFSRIFKKVTGYTPTDFKS
jgi:two-component system, response regulator YesN